MGRRPANAPSESSTDSSISVPGEEEEEEEEEESILNNYESANEEEEEDGKVAAVASTSSSQNHYESANGCKRVLFSMCTGLLASDNTDARILGEFNVEPYDSSKNKKLFKPNRQDWVDEEYCRLQVFGHAGVRADN